VRAVHVVLPNDIDDPMTPSGGNTYDRRVCVGLADSGWFVQEHAVKGDWPHPNATHRADLASLLATLADDALVLLDGLVACAAPDILVPQSRRLRLVVLVHMPLENEQEREVLSAAAAVVTTSLWSRRRLLDRYRLPAAGIHVASPGVEARPVVPGSQAGSRLLCVAAVAPHKGHDVLMQALASIADLDWSCVCVGTLSRDREFADRLLRETRQQPQISFVGPHTGEELDARYAAADLLVLASRGETYGMVVTEALARGIPVLTTTAGGLPEALGNATDGSMPGILVAPDDYAALASGLRRWLTEPQLRSQLRSSARNRRITLTGWANTSGFIANILSGTRSRPDAKIASTGARSALRLLEKPSIQDKRHG
jgi:hypothetical protein